MQKLFSFKLIYSLLTDAFILFFSGPKSKIVISNRNWVFFLKNTAAIKQHAIHVVRKRAGECMLFHFLFPFIFWLEFKAYGDDPHVL